MAEKVPIFAEGDDWLSGRIFAAILGILIFAQFPQVLLGLQTFVARDYGFFAYPLAHFQQQCFWRGELPAWNPYNNCGIPFLAQWNTMCLYPPAIIYLLFPLKWSLSFFCLLHLFSGGMGLYFLAKRFSGSNYAAAVGGVLFTFSGLSLNFLMWPSYIATYSWMPWVVLTAERGWREGGSKLVLAAIIGAFQMLAGGPEAIFLTWILLSLMWLGVLISQLRQSGLGSFRFAQISRFPLIVVLVTGLCAIQLLPFMDLTAHSQRGVGYGSDRWAMPLRGWANFFVPMVFGRVWNIGVFYQHNQEWTSSYYIPIGGLVLGLLALVLARKRPVWLFAGTAFAGLLLAFGQQAFLFRALRWLVPQLSIVTFPIKFVSLVCFAIPLLAAFSVGSLVNDRSRYITQLKWLMTFPFLALATVFGVLIWASSKPMPQDYFPATLRNGIWRAAFLVGEIGLVIFWLKFRNARLGKVLACALLFAFWLDTWTHEPNQNPTVSPSIFQPGLVRTKLDMKPEPMIGQSRIMLTSSVNRKFNLTLMSDLGNEYLIKRLGYYADCNLLDEVPKVNGFFPLYPRETGDIIRLLYGTTNEFPRLLDFLSVSHETKNSETIEWTPRETWQPEVTAGQQPIFLDRTEALSVLTSDTFDSAKIVILPVEDKASVKASGIAECRISSEKWHLSRLDFDIDAPRPCLAVISQTYYHLWHARIDGKPSAILRANHAFQAVEVSGGHHHVEMAYRNTPLLSGGIISFATIVVCVAICTFRKNCEQR